MKLFALLGAALATEVVIVPDDAGNSDLADGTTGGNRDADTAGPDGVVNGGCRACNHATWALCVADGAAFEECWNGDRDACYLEVVLDGKTGGQKWIRGGCKNHQVSPY